MPVIVRSVRRVTNDARHNAFTGACWFKGHLYLAYRQGDSHICPYGRLVVLRSRDEGASWEHVAVVRGPADTRDAHLYTDGKRLYCVGILADRRSGAARHGSGCAVTSDGDRWSAWRAYAGTGSDILWRPRAFNGRHYCAAYALPQGIVNWYESGDGLSWKKTRVLYKGTDRPSECYLDLDPEGRAHMLMRCEAGPHHPRLWTSRYPFRKWSQQVLTGLSATGPCLWTIGDEVYIGVRCHSLEGLPGRDAPVFASNSQASIFRIVGGRPELEWVLPAGPGFDNAYLAAAPFPLNPRRVMLSFYSDAIAPDNGTVSQWTHPDIYLADVLFGNPPCVRDGFRVSALMAGLAEPDSAGTAFDYRTDIQAGGDFLDLKDRIRGRAGYVYAQHDFELKKAGPMTVHLGYDGPIHVWWNGTRIFQGPGHNPAIKDQTSLAVPGKAGSNRLTIALDTNGGRAEGVFVRVEKT